MIRIILVCTFIPFLLPTSLSYSRPKDLSVSAFEEFKKHAEKTVKIEIEEEFKKREEGVQKLSKPFKKGDTVSIAVVQGDRKRKVTGTFNGIKGPYAVIDDKNILLTDIDDLDSNRLFFADQAQLLQLKINQLRRKLEEDKERRREVLLELKYKDAGYVEKFFDRSVILSDRYWPISDLGDRRFFLQVERSDDSEFANLDLINAAEQECEVIVMLETKPIYSSSALPNKKKSMSQTWRRISIPLFKTDLGEHPFKYIASKLRIRVLKRGVGVWYMKPSLEGQPTTGTSDRILCPECQELGPDASRFVDQEMSEKDTDAKGLENPKDKEFPVTKARYIFHIVRTTIKQFTQSHAAETDSLIQASANYQDQVYSRAREIQAQLRQEQHEHQKKVMQRAEKIRKLEEAKRQREERIQNIEQNYVWLAVDAASESQEAPSTGVKAISSKSVNHPEYPTLFDGRPVSKLTEWQRIRSRDRELSGQRYRILRIDGEPKDPLYYLQYKVSYTNQQHRLIDLETTVTVTYNDSSETAWRDTFRIPPNWSGDLYGAQEISTALMEKSFEKIVIEKAK